MTGAGQGGNAPPSLLRLLEPLDGFARVRLIEADQVDGVTVPVMEIPADWAPELARVRALPAWAGVAAPAVMGILNVTPDSFSDGGLHAATEAAVAAGRRMIEAGAAILDIGGESTRPGAEEVPAELEQARILPVIRALAGSVPLSVDTRHAATMRAALAAGADIINDVSALTHDPHAAEVVARAGCPVVLMHMRGTPATMGRLTQYRDVAVEVVRELAARVAAAEAAGIARHLIAVDPGIGFAKTPAQSVELLRRLALLRNLGCAVLLGVSRKRFITALAGDAPPQERLGGSLAAMLAGLDAGARVLRVHDVAASLQALAVWQALRGG